ncbi:unnamed protein product, partial [Phaeothamnion confervicola]
MIAGVRDQEDGGIAVLGHGRRCRQSTSYPTSSLPSEGPAWDYGVGISKRDDATARALVPACRSAEGSTAPLSRLPYLVPPPVTQDAAAAHSVSDPSEAVPQDGLLLAESNGGNDLVEGESTTPAHRGGETVNGGMTSAEVGGEGPPEGSYSDTDASGDVEAVPSEAGDAATSEVGAAAGADDPNGDAASDSDGDEEAALELQQRLKQVTQQKKRFDETFERICAEDSGGRASLRSTKAARGGSDEKRPRGAARPSCGGPWGVAAMEKGSRGGGRRKVGRPRGPGTASENRSASPPPPPELAMDETGNGAAADFGSSPTSDARPCRKRKLPASGAHASRLSPPPPMEGSAESRGAESEDAPGESGACAASPGSEVLMPAAPPALGEETAAAFAPVGFAPAASPRKRGRPLGPRRAAEAAARARSAEEDTAKGGAEGAVAAAAAPTPSEAAADLESLSGDAEGASASAAGKDGGSSGCTSSGKGASGGDGAVAASNEAGGEDGGGDGSAMEEVAEEEIGPWQPPKLSEGETVVTRGDGSALVLTASVLQSLSSGPKTDLELRHAVRQDMVRCRPARGGGSDASEAPQGEPFEVRLVVDVLQALGLVRGDIADGADGCGPAELHPPSEEHGGEPEPCMCRKVLADASSFLGMPFTASLPQDADAAIAAAAAHPDDADGDTATVVAAGVGSGGAASGWPPAPGSGGALSADSMAMPMDGGVVDATKPSLFASTEALAVTLAAAVDAPALAHILECNLAAIAERDWVGAFCDGLGSAAAAQGSSRTQEEAAAQAVLAASASAAVRFAQEQVAAGSWNPLSRPFSAPAAAGIAPRHVILAAAATVGPAQQAWLPYEHTRHAADSGGGGAGSGASSWEGARAASTLMMPSLETPAAASAGKLLPHSEGGMRVLPEVESSEVAMPDLNRWRYNGYGSGGSSGGAVDEVAGSACAVGGLPAPPAPVPPDYHYPPYGNVHGHAGPASGPAGAAAYGNTAMARGGGGMAGVAWRAPGGGGVTVQSVIAGAGIRAPFLLSPIVARAPAGLRAALARSLLEAAEAEEVAAAADTAGDDGPLDDLPVQMKCLAEEGLLEVIEVVWGTHILDKVYEHLSEANRDLPIDAATFRLAMEGAIYPGGPLDRKYGRAVYETMLGWLHARSPEWQEWRDSWDLARGRRCAPSAAAAAAGGGGFGGEQRNRPAVPAAAVNSNRRPVRFRLDAEQDRMLLDWQQVARQLEGLEKEVARLQLREEIVMRGLCKGCGVTLPLGYTRKDALERLMGQSAAAARRAGSAAEAAKRKREAAGSGGGSSSGGGGGDNMVFLGGGGVGGGASDIGGSVSDGLRSSSQPVQGLTAVAML